MMKLYRTLKSGWKWTTARGQELTSVLGEEAELTDEQFAAAPPGTFTLKPGQPGYVEPKQPDPPAVDTHDPPKPAPFRAKPRR